MNKTEIYPLWEICLIGNNKEAVKCFKLFGWDVVFISHFCNFSHYEEIYCKTDICLN